MTYQSHESHETPASIGGGQSTMEVLAYHEPVREARLLFYFLLALDLS